jgi:hypothetical protein
LSAFASFGGGVLGGFSGGLGFFFFDVFDACGVFFVLRLFFLVPLSPTQK